MLLVFGKVGLKKNFRFFSGTGLIDLFSRKSPRKSSPSISEEDLIVIREIYDSENAQEIFEIELERAIQVSIICHKISERLFFTYFTYFNSQDVKRS